MPEIVCVAVFTASIAFSVRLGQFLKGCDRREADVHVVEAAERIVREAARP
jgi:hypothetical protein